MVLKWFGFCDMVLATQIRAEKDRGVNVEGAFWVLILSCARSNPHCGSYLESTQAGAHAGCAHTAGMGRRAAGDN